MKRPLVSVAAASALLLSIYACSGDSSNDGSAPTGDDASAGSSGSSGTSGGPGDPDARLDAPANLDAATNGDAAIDGDAAVDATVDAGPPAVKFIGRFDMTPAAGPMVAYGGAEIVARFSGTEVKATFSDAVLYTDYGANRWEAVVDGVSVMTMQLDRSQATTYTLATGLVAGPHTVELYKLTEGDVGTTQFQGFELTGGTLLPPPLPKTRHLQFLGDSASSGYGVEGANATCKFSALTENERKSYPALIANELLADHHNLAAAGKGVFQNNYRPDDTEVYSIIYQHVGVSAATPTWDATSYVPDVVWITLGGNDYDVPSEMGGAGAPTVSQFQASYDALVTKVRAQYPSAHIFCAVAPSLSDSYPAGYNAYTSVKTALQNVVAAHAADPKVYYFEFTRSTDADLTACEGHPNVAKHRAMADEAITLIKAKTGW